LLPVPEKSIEQAEVPRPSPFDKHWVGWQILLPTRGRGGGGSPGCWWPTSAVWTRERGPANRTRARATPTPFRRLVTMNRAPGTPCFAGRCHLPPLPRLCRLKPAFPSGFGTFPFQTTSNTFHLNNISNGPGKRLNVETVWAEALTTAQGCAQMALVPQTPLCLTLPN